MKYFAVLLCLLLATMAKSRELSDLERSDLQQRLEQFNSAMLESDFTSVIDILPPKIFEYLATQNGLMAEDIREASAEQMHAMSSSFVIHEIASSTAETDIIEVTMEGFAEILYGAARLQFIATIDDQRASFDTQVLTVFDDGEWYLMRVDSDKQLDILIEIYPFLTDFKVRPAIIRLAEY